MSEKFREILAMLMAEEIDFTLEQGITRYYLIHKENWATVWELDDGDTNIYFYNEMGKRYTFASPNMYIGAIQIAVHNFFTYS